MQYINGHIYLTVTELQAWGVPADTVKTGCKRYNQGQSPNWANVPDPADKRRVLVDAESLPASTRVKYKIPYAEQLLEQYKAEQKLAANSQGMAQVLELRTEAFKQGLNATEAEQIIRLAQWLKSVSCPPKGRTKAQHCQDVVEAMAQEYSQGMLYGTAISSAEYLEKLARKFAKEGIGSLISKRVGNKNAERLTDDHKLFIYTLAREAQKLDDTYVYQQLQLASQDRNWNHLEPVSLRTVRRYINQPEVQAALYQNRYGKAASSMGILPYARRSKPTYSLSLLVGDGYRMGLPVRIPYGHRFLSSQLWSRKRMAKGKDRDLVTQLMVFIWFDVATGAVVGYDFDIAEPAMLVRKSLRHVVATTGGRVPLEVMTDRKVISNDETQQMLERMGIGFDNSKQPYAPWQNIAERYNKELSKWLRRTQCMWQTTTNHHADYVHNPEHHRSGEAVHIDDALKGFAQMVALYNQDVPEGQPTKLEDCLSRINPNCAQLDELNRVTMFGMHRRVTQHNGFVQLTLSSREFVFELPNYASFLKTYKPDQKLWLYYDEESLDRVQVFVASTMRPEDAAYATYWGEAKQARSFNMAAAERTSDDYKQLSASVARKREVLEELQAKDDAMMQEAERRGIIALGLKAGQERYKMANVEEHTRHLNERVMSGWGTDAPAQDEPELVPVYTPKRSSGSTKSRLELLQEQARQAGL